MDPDSTFCVDADKVAGGSASLNADPDPGFHFNADLDPGFHFYEDPDPYQSDRKFFLGTTGLYTIQGSILSLQSSICERPRALLGFFLTL